MIKILFARLRLLSSPLNLQPGSVAFARSTENVVVVVVVSSSKLLDTFSADAAEHRRLPLVQHSRIRTIVDTTTTLRVSFFMIITGELIDFVR